MKKDNKNNNKPAFTLIELLVVIAIIGILTALAVVSLQNSRRSARDAKRVADVKQMQIALELYVSDNNIYPPTLNPGESLSSNSITYMEQIPYPPTNLDGDCSTTSYIYSTSNDNNYYNIHFCIGNNVGSLLAGEVVASPRGLGEWACGDSFKDTRDNQIYNTVQIGNQCWMSENLNIGTMIDGVSSSTNENGVNSIIEKYCYDNNESDCDLYGGLYQWNEAMNYTTSTTQGICPEGWHVPTSQEWDNLAGPTGYINTNYPNYLCNGGNGKAFASNYGWDLDTNTCTVGNNQEINNTTEFNALPVGFYVPSSPYYSWGFYARNGVTFFWSSSTNPFSYLFYYLEYDLITFSPDAISSADRGYSIRCLKD